MKLLCSIAVLIFCPALLLEAQRIAIVGALVIDGSGSPAAPQTVIVNGGKIEAVGPALPVPAGATVFQAQGMTLLPGLFDVHTHLLASAGGVSADWGVNLKAYLLSGVTTVVDLSAYPEQFEPMRRLLAAGQPGPTILLAARLSTPGGHGAEGGRGDFHTQLVQTPREARAAVERLLPYKPDLLKVFTDGWRYGAATDMTSMDEATLTALVDEAHKHSLKVLTHTVTLEKAKIAARSRVDLIIHGISNQPADEELLQLMKKNGTGYASTLAVYEPRSARDPKAPLLQTVLEPALKQEQAAPQRRTTGSGESRSTRWENLMANVRMLREAHLQHALGTDAGMPGTYHGWATLHELELLAQAGLTPLEAITAGTGASARYLGIDKERGFIREGNIADLVLVEGNAAEDIQAIYRIKHVFQAGREVDREALARQIASSAPAPLPSRKAQALLDDFESKDGRSRIDTLWINNTDAGVDHSEMSYQRTQRPDGTNVLTVLCKAAEKDTPACVMVLPLAKGSIEPVDASAFHGVEFDARGAGAYSLRTPTSSVRDRHYFAADFQAGPAWRKVQIPFTSLKRPEGRPSVTWTGSDVLNIEFVISRKAGENAWLEIDNVRFF
jgi:imidazolonepropionase-like amidohydrolase